MLNPKSPRGRIGGALAFVLGSKPMVILEVLLALAFLLWLLLAIFMVWATQGGIILRPGQTSDLGERAPKVSIVVPARNEAETLPAALESLLKLDYPDYEVIVVDDASTDETGRIAEEWGAHPAARGRVRVIHIRELPAGWTGKVHALSLAASAATGEWILATDADVVFHPEIVRRAVSLALQKSVQLVSLTPEFELGGFWEKVPRAIAAGAFILMRREDFEALGGYEPIKNVVIEDVRMAEQFKMNGRRIYLAATRGLFHTRMYKGFHELWEGLSRSAFEGTGFSVVKVLGGTGLGALMGVLPAVALLVFFFRDLATEQSLNGATALALAVLAWAESTLVYLPVILFLRVPVQYVFTLPLATLFYMGVGWNSMFRSLFGSGVSWKGRRYRPPG